MHLSMAVGRPLPSIKLSADALIRHGRPRRRQTRFGEVDELGVTTWYPPLRHFQRRRERNEHHDRSETRLGGRISQPEKAGCTAICNDVIDLTALRFHFFSPVKADRYLRIAGRLLEPSGKSGSELPEEFRKGVADVRVNAPIA